MSRTVKIVANVRSDFKNAMLDHIAKSGGRWSSQSHFIHEACVNQMAKDRVFWKMRDEADGHRNV